MRARVLVPLVLMAGLALAPAASAAVLCVGTSGGECTQSYATTGQAVGAALDRDTIRFGAGIFGPVDTTKVLTYEGVGAGTPDSAAGATVIRQTTAGATGMEIPNGGTVRQLRVEGGPHPGGMGVGGTGINFAPATNGDAELSLVDVITTGGATTSAPVGGTGLALGGALTTGRKVATVTRGAIMGSATPGAGGMGVYTCCIQSTITGSLIRTGGGPAVYASIDSTLTLDGATVEGVTGIRTQGPTGVTVNRSRIDAAGVGLFLRSELNEPTDVLLRDSFVSAGSSGGETGAAVDLEGALGAPVVFNAVGSTLVARGTSNGVDAMRAAEDSASITATLRNSIARAEGSGVDLLADRATIGADFSSFNTRMLANGGAAPDPGSGGNVAGDPVFAPDHSLQPGSPLIDRGDPSALLPGELDLAGSARSLDGNGDCVTAPDIGAFERPGTCVIAPNVAPQLSAVGVTNRVFAPVAKRRARGAARKRKVKRGTRFRYTLSEPARMAITIQRRVVRRRGKQRRVRWPTVVVLRADKQGGKQRTAFTGRVRGRALKRGAYRAKLVATDSLGARSKVKKISLRVVRP